MFKVFRELRKKVMFGLMRRYKKSSLKHSIVLPNENFTKQEFENFNRNEVGKFSNKEPLGSDKR